MSYNSQRVPRFAAYGGVPQDAAYGGIPTEEAYRLAREKKEREENYNILASNHAANTTQDMPHNCFMRFNGKNLSLYDKGQLVDNLDAMSGQKDFQAKEFQNIPDKGPLPEGTYFAHQNQRQEITPYDAIVGGITQILNIDRGKWKGSLPAWGTRRVWLEPDKNTNMYGRNGFSIHGGFSKGSAGCIDIPWQTDRFSNYLDNCQESVPVYVKYPDKNW